MAEKEFCPRGIESGGGPDSPFKAPFNGEMEWLDDGTCSYCGSISEGAFFNAIEAGAKITPTDKSYKAYIDMPGVGHRKFYFQHLSQEGRARFIDLVNKKKINLAEPGYFYVPPYFAAPSAHGAER
ncbi:MAG: hypothetical protein KDJ69_10045 [Nitratireductor sp.]|nr:hypothetical protein [Nitratireductor sp.]